jgi:hypothetical protein
MAIIFSELVGSQILLQVNPYNFELAEIRDRMRDHDIYS